MSLFNEDFLRAFGWSEFFSRRLEGLDGLVARVIGEEKGHYRVQYEIDRIAQATVAGKLNYEARTRRDYPAVGDFVVCQPTGDPLRVVISHVLERKSSLERAALGGAHDVQIIATNVDWVLIATSVNEDLNLRRLDRYVSLAWSSGSSPVILLTKSDLRDGVDELAREVEARFIGVNVHRLRVVDRDPVSELERYLRPGQTSVVVGSSGVGKSTLVNKLLGREALATKEIREDDGRGRHTTTSRYLFTVPMGGVLIDTPGMREIAMTDDDSGLETQFADVEALASRCRFGDCAHETEPDCRIRDALATGELDEERWESYRKLLREIRHQMRKLDPEARAAQREHWKKIHVAQRKRRKLEGR